MFCLFYLVVVHFLLFSFVLSFFDDEERRKEM